MLLKEEFDQGTQESKKPLKNGFKMQFINIYLKYLSKAVWEIDLTLYLCS